MTKLEQFKITPDTLGLLMYVDLNTNPTEYISQQIKKYLFEIIVISENQLNMADILEKQGLVKYIKTGKKDPWYRIRLDKKGEDILKSLSQKPEHSLAQNCWNILSESYKQDDVDKSKIINQTKTTFYISEFLYAKDNIGKPYTEKMFKALVIDYLESFSYEKKIYVKKTLNLLFDPSNKFASKFSIEDCPLWSWSENNKESIQKTYKKLN